MTKRAWRTAARSLTVMVVAGVVAASCGSAGQPAASKPLEVIETQAAADRAASMSSESMYGGKRTYVAAADLGSLPNQARAWRFTPAEVDVAQVSALARALGIDGEPVTSTDEKSGGWQVGTDPARLLRVTNDAVASWYVATSSDVSSACVVAEESRAITGPASDDQTTSDAPAASGDPSKPDAPDAPVASDGGASCPSTPAAENLLDADGALAAARKLITAAGFDPDAFTMTTTVDQWAATVNAMRKIDGLDTDLGWSTTFGSNGALVWASGSLAEPAPAGDYPLVDVATALERLNRGPVTLIAPVDCGRSAADAPDSADTSAVPCPEPIPTAVTSVQLSLSSVWTGDGRVWLAPSFRFGTGANDEITVVAVTDEYFREIDGTATTDPGSTGSPGSGSSSGSGGTDGGSVEPAPPSQAPEPGNVTVSPEEAQRLVGLSEDEATKVAAQRGWVLRVSERDGETSAGTADYRVDRVNVIMTSGVVAAVTVG